MPALQQLLPRRAELVTFVARRVGIAAAEDIVHAAFVRMLEHEPDLRDEGALLGWFYRVLRNATTDHLRRRTRHARLDKALALELPTSQPANDDTHDAARTAQRARELVARLTPTHREALEIVYLHGGSIADLATRAGVSRNSATVRVHRAREALRSLMH